MRLKRIFDDYLSDQDWLIEQLGCQKEMQQVREAHFALGNGIIGSRGVMEDLPYDANAGTFVAGVFDRFGAQIPELVNLPNPIVFRADVGGEKLDPAAMDIVDHYRALDMKQGLLVRRTVYETAHKNRIDYQSYRFISQYQKYIGAMVITITPIDKEMTFNIHTTVDTSVCNRGVLTEGRKRHFEVTAVSSEKNCNYTEVQTLEHRHIVGYATCLEIIKGGKRRIAKNKSFKIKAKKGETIKFIKYFTIVPSFYLGKKDIKKIAKKELARGRMLGVTRLLNSHKKAWEKLWDVADINLDGAHQMQKALRFNIYHLLISGFPDNRLSIGARTLSGEGYRGHIFWDAETFIFPFFLHTEPKVAKSMLRYRYDRLDHARKIAAAKGYKGVLFPWESADTGEETTPSWFKDLTGEVLKIETLEEEHHLVADIAYAFNQYVEATDDKLFMINYGLEVMIETARFWASRVCHNKKKDRYEIHNAMGPDEFHSDVNNSVFTNEMARHNLRLADKWIGWAMKSQKVKCKKLFKRLKATDKEFRKWRMIADKIYIPYNDKKKIFEQFDNYLKLKNVRITQLDQYFMPVVPPHAHPVEDGKTQLIKQADIVMLMYLLRQNFTNDEIERNFHFYAKRTLHKSSLSPSVHSAVAARLGDLDNALSYLNIALNSDLLDIHGNAGDGFHAASGGGVWQAIVIGFGGMDIRPDRIVFNPILPKFWKTFSFNVYWKGVLLEVVAMKDEVHVRRKGPVVKKKIVVEVGGVKKNVPARKTVRFLKTEITHRSKAHI